MISTLCTSLSQDSVQMMRILHAFINIAVGQIASILLEFTVMCGQLMRFDEMTDVMLQKHSTLIKVETTIKTINDKTVQRCSCMKMCIQTCTFSQDFIKRKIFLQFMMITSSAQNDVCHLCLITNQKLHAICSSFCNICTYMRTLIEMT